MPPIAKIQPASDYQELQAKAQSLGLTNACGPIALALLTGHSLEQALEACREEGWDPKIGMFTGKLLSCFNKLGFKTIRVDDSSILSEYPRGGAGFKNVTTHHPRRFPHVFKGKDYLILTKGHFVACKGGEVKCYTVNSSLRAVGIYAILADAPPAAKIEKDKPKRVRKPAPKSTKKTKSKSN